MVRSRRIATPLDKYKKAVKVVNEIKSKFSIDVIKRNRNLYRKQLATGNTSNNELKEFEALYRQYHRNIKVIKNYEALSQALIQDYEMAQKQEDEEIQADIDDYEAEISGREQGLVSHEYCPIRKKVITEVDLSYDQTNILLKKKRYYQKLVDSSNRQVDYYPAYTRGTIWKETTNKEVALEMKNNKEDLRLNKKQEIRLLQMVHMAVPVISVRQYNSIRNHLAMGEMADARTQFKPFPLLLYALGLRPTSLQNIT